MSDSLITKKAIADGLKELTRTRNFDKISVSDITGICGLNRQTFYYHFQDKYELLSWIYYNEGFSSLIEGINLENWDIKLWELLNKMKREQVFYVNTIKNEGACFQDYLWSISRTLFFEAMEKLDVHHKISDEEKTFYAGFFSYGICGTIVFWVKDGMKEDTRELSARLKKLALNCEKLAHQRYVDEHNDICI